MTPIRMPALAVVFALSATIACTHTQVWVASGESLVVLGESFVATGHAMDAALDAKTVDEATYRRWAAFARYFKPAYETAADRWLHSDDSASKHAAAVLASLSAELAEWAAVAGGKP